MVPPSTMLMTKLTLWVYDIRRAIPTASFTPASDHIPVRATTTLRHAPPPAKRPIPRWITSHPLYAARAQKLRTLQLDGVAPSDAMRRTRHVLRTEAAGVRNTCLNRKPRSGSEATQLALQAARAIHRCDFQALRREAARWPALATLLDDDGTTIHTSNERAVHKLLGAAITDPDSLAHQRMPGATAGGGARRAPTGGGMTKFAVASVLLRSAPRRWFRLWVPHVRRQWPGHMLPEPDATIIGGAPTDDERRLQRPTDSRRTLPDFWAPVFAAIDERRADDLIRRHIRPSGGRDIPPPTTMTTIRAHCAGVRWPTLLSVAVGRTRRTEHSPALLVRGNVDGSVPRPVSRCGGGVRSKGQHSQ